MSIEIYVESRQHENTKPLLELLDTQRYNQFVKKRKGPFKMYGGYWLSVTPPPLLSRYLRMESTWSDTHIAVTFNPSP